MWLLGDSAYTYDSSGSYPQLRLRRFDLETGAELATVRHSRIARDLLLEGDALYVLCEKGVDLYDPQTLELRESWKRIRLPHHGQHILPFGDTVGIVTYDRVTAFSPTREKKRVWSFDGQVRAASNCESVLVGTVDGTVHLIAGQDERSEQTAEVGFVNSVAACGETFVVFTSSQRRRLNLTPNAKPFPNTIAADIVAHEFTAQGSLIRSAPIGAAHWLAKTWYVPESRTLYVLKLDTSRDASPRSTLRAFDCDTLRWRTRIPIATDRVQSVDRAGRNVALTRSLGDGRLEVAVAELTS